MSNTTWKPIKLGTHELRKPDGELQGYMTLTPVRLSWLDALDNHFEIVWGKDIRICRQVAQPTPQQAVDEIALWQDAIYKLLQRYAEPLDILIDGAGSDGDELDFTLAEIEQLIAGLIDKLDEAQPTPPVPSDVREAIAAMIRAYYREQGWTIEYSTAANWLTAQEGASDER